MKFNRSEKQSLARHGANAPWMLSKVLSCLLLIASPLSYAADHFVPANVSEVNCGNYGGGVRAGDTLTLAAGDRGPLTVQSCKGTSSQAITIRNDAAGSGPTVIRRSSAGSGGFVFRCHDCVHVEIDGTQRWTGFPDGGYCGAPAGRNGCGIKVTSVVSNDAPTAYLKISGMSTSVTVRGVEVDGGMAALKTTGVGIDLNDHSITVAGHPDFWRENFVFEGNYVRDVFGEGMYLGPNWREPDLRAPLRNITIRNNLVEDTGRESIQLKSAIDGTNQIHHNVVRRSGLRVEGTVQGAGISVVEGGAALKIHSNWVEDAGVQGIQHYNGNIPMDRGTFQSEIYNNVVYRAGRLGGADSRGHGITAASSSGGAPITAAVYYNTIIEAADSGINFNSGVVNSSARDNIIVESGGDPLSLSGNGQENNFTGALATVHFVSPQERNFQLTAESPVIDLGSLAGAPASDFLGNVRPHGNRPDIGAFEYMGDEALPKFPETIKVE